LLVVGSIIRQGNVLAAGECSYSVWLVLLQAWTSCDHAGVFWGGQEAVDGSLGWKRSCKRHFFVFIYSV